MGGGGGGGGGYSAQTSTRMKIGFEKKVWTRMSNGICMDRR